ncbi:hypothetical protein TraAM80_06940, partial [Trypanosoma rangeli]
MHTKLIFHNKYGGPADGSPTVDNAAKLTAANLTAANVTAANVTAAETAVKQPPATTHRGGSPPPVQPVSAESPEATAAERRFQPNHNHRLFKPPSDPLNRATMNGEGRTVVVSLDNFERAPRVKGVLNSPRSLKACRIEEVDPTELLPRKVTDFMGVGVPQDLAKLRHDFFEQRRGERVERVRRTRSKLLAEEEKAVPPEETA